MKRKILLLLLLFGVAVLHAQIEGYYTGPFTLNGKEIANREKEFKKNAASIRTKKLSTTLDKFKGEISKLYKANQNVKGLEYIQRIKSEILASNLPPSKIYPLFVELVKAEASFNYRKLELDPAIAQIIKTLDAYVKKYGTTDLIRYPNKTIDVVEDHFLKSYPISRNKQTRVKSHVVKYLSGVMNLKSTTSDEAGQQYTSLLGKAMQQDKSMEGIDMSFHPYMLIFRIYSWSTMYKDISPLQLSKVKEDAVAQKKVQKKESSNGVTGSNEYYSGPVTLNGEKISDREQEFKANAGSIRTQKISTTVETFKYEVSKLFETYENQKGLEYIQKIENEILASNLPPSEIYNLFIELVKAEASFNLRAYTLDDTIAEILNTLEAYIQTYGLGDIVRNGNKSLELATSILPNTYPPRIKEQNRMNAHVIQYLLKRMGAKTSQSMEEFAEESNTMMEKLMDEVKNSGSIDEIKSHPYFFMNSLKTFSFVYKDTSPLKTTKKGKKKEVAQGGITRRKVTPKKARKKKPSTGVVRYEDSFSLEDYLDRTIESLIEQAKSFGADDSVLAVYRSEEYRKQLIKDFEESGITMEQMKTYQDVLAGKTTNIEDFANDKKPKTAFNEYSRLQSVLLGFKSKSKKEVAEYAAKLRKAYQGLTSKEREELYASESAVSTQIMAVYYLNGYYDEAYDELVSVMRTSSLDALIKDEMLEGVAVYASAALLFRNQDMSCILNWGYELDKKVANNPKLRKENPEVLTFLGRVFLSTSFQKNLKSGDCKLTRSIDSKTSKAKSVGYFKEVVEIYKNAMYGDYAMTQPIMGELANVYYYLGQLQQSEQLMNEFIEGQINMSFKNSIDQNTLKSTMNTLYTEIQGSLIFSYVNFAKKLEGEGYNYALILKELLLNRESIIESVAKRNPNLRLVYQDYIDAKEAYTNIHYEKRDSIQDKLNYSLATIFANDKNNLMGDFLKTKVNWKDIKDHLKSDEVAVEFVKYSPAYFSSGLVKDDSYGAFILKSDSKSPEFIGLFGEQVLTPMLKYSDVEDIYEKQNSQRLHDLIWGKIKSKVGNVKTIYYSPTGVLNSVAHHALKDKSDTYLADQFDLIQVTSTRNIIGLKENTSVKPQQNREVALFGGIDYNYKFSFEPPANSIGKATRGKLDYLRDLPHTLNEVVGISDILEANKINFSLFLDVTHLPPSKKKDIGSRKKFKIPSESNFYEIIKRKPSIIHIATHGAYLDEAFIQAKGVIRLSSETDPMNKSLIAFTGAQYFWRKGIKPQFLAEDGLLTSNEISLRNLKNTQLVILSACETGLGKAVGNEGVFGLQRGLKLAGVDNLMLSLWEVNDGSSRDFMTTFYGNLFNKKYDLRNAYNKTMTEIRKKYPNPKDWAAFILIQ